MNLVITVYTGVLISTILCASLLIKYAYRKKAMPGADYFILLMLSAILYSGTYIGEVCSNRLNTALFWFYLEHIPIPIQHYLWMVMSVKYCKVSEGTLKKAKYIGLLYPILYMLIFFTNHIHHLYISGYSFESNGYFNIIASVKGPLFALMVLSGTVLGVLSMVAYIRAFLRSSSVHKYSYIIMIIASLFPWIAVYLSAANKNFLGIDYFPVVSIVSGGLYFIGIFYFNLFNVIPIATEMVFRQSKEPIMIIDLAEYIVDVNEAFVSIYPELKELQPKYYLNAFIERHCELKPVQQGKTEFQLCLEKNKKQQYYWVEVTHIILDEGTSVGKIVTLHDITSYIENQKTLESIASTAMIQAETNEVSFLQAQIKPHFINNILSVLGSMISRDPQGARDLIGNLGEYLANCYYFDSTSPFVWLEEELETIETYVSIEKARFGERLHYYVECEKIPAVHIPRLILQPLVENAIRHGILKKAQGGNVWLSIVVEPTKVSFEIRDDGVGMSQDKLTQIFGNTKPNQGIGISNIHIRLLKYYGDGLKINSTEKEGTCVTFSIPYTSC